jgi:hypothetical protein
LSRRPAALLSAVILLLAMAVPAQAAGERSGHAEILAYWTPARVASAIPRDPRVAPNPAAKPSNPGGKPGGGGGGETTTVSGAKWNGTGRVQEATGRVLFTMGSSNYVCSGAVASDTRTGYSLVLTAAHCAFDERTGNFATNWMFVPNYQASPTFTCANTKYGCWTASSLVVHSGYATAGGFNSQAIQHDWAFAVVGSGGKGGGQLDATVGSFTFSSSSHSDGTQVYAFGYPAAQKYKGRDLIYCAGPTFSDPYQGGVTYGLTCDMTGGSSGGPWFTDFNTSTGIGTLSSVNSYGYTGINAMHGPKFNATTQATYTSANSATTTNVIVGP